MGFQFGTILVFAIVTVGFALGGVTLSRFAGPRAPNPEKASIYECGERPIGVAWFNFNPRFYMVALVFVIFEVDIAFTFPVVAVFREWTQASPTMGWIAFVELFLFTAILLTGLAWVWAHGDLDWVKTLGSPAEAPRREAAPGRKAA